MTAEEYTNRAMTILPMQQLGKHGKEHIRKCLLVLFEECVKNEGKTDSNPPGAIRASYGDYFPGS